MATFGRESLFWLLAQGSSPSWWGMHSGLRMKQLVILICSHEAERNESWCSAQLLFIQSVTLAHKGYCPQHVGVFSP